MGVQFVAFRNTSVLSAAVERRINAETKCAFVSGVLGQRRELTRFFGNNPAAPLLPC
jgi:hypothetical protein